MTAKARRDLNRGGRGVRGGYIKSATDAGRVGLPGAATVTINQDTHAAIGPPLRACFDGIPS